MAHYIDSDKLKAKIKRELKRLEPYNKETLNGAAYTMGHALGQKDAYNELLFFIESLQEPEVNLDEEITSNPSYNPNYHDKMSLYQETLYKISTILSKYEDKDGSPLEQIRSIVINDTIDKMEKEPEVDLEKKECKLEIEDERAYFTGR